MKNVSIERGTLLVILKENRDKHKLVYEKMMKKYQKAALDNLQAEVKRIIKEQDAERNSSSISITVQPPSSYLNQYDRAIRMIELDTRENVELDTREFDQYIMDNWGWQSQYGSTLLSYMSVSNQALGQSLERADLEDSILSSNQGNLTSDDLLSNLGE